MNSINSQYAILSHLKIYRFTTTVSMVTCKMNSHTSLIGIICKERPTEKTLLKKITEIVPL